MLPEIRNSCSTTASVAGTAYTFFSKADMFGSKVLDVPHDCKGLLNHLTLRDFVFRQCRLADILYIKISGLSRAGPGLARTFSTPSPSPPELSVHQARARPIF